MTLTLAFFPVGSGSTAANWYVQLAYTAWYPISVGAGGSGVTPAGPGIGEPVVRLWCEVVVFRYIPYNTSAPPSVVSSPNTGNGAPSSSHEYPRPWAASALACAFCAV